MIGTPAEVSTPMVLDAPPVDFASIFPILFLVSDAESPYLTKAEMTATLGALSGHLLRYRAQIPASTLTALPAAVAKWATAAAKKIIKTKQAAGPS